MVGEIKVLPGGKVNVDFNLLAGLRAPAIPLNEYLEIDLQPKETPPETVGQQIKACREGRGMTQKAFAALLGVNAYTVSLWELGRREPSAASRKLIEARTGLVLGPAGRKADAA